MAHRRTAAAHEEDSLGAALGELRDEIRVLRMAIDDLREEVAWANQNPPQPLPDARSPYRLVSMPRDPTDDDFAERVNSVPAEIVDRLRQEVLAESQTSPLGRQQQLW